MSEDPRWATRTPPGLLSRAVPESLIEIMEKIPRKWIPCITGNRSIDNYILTFLPIKERDYFSFAEYLKHFSKNIRPKRISKVKKFICERHSIFAELDRQGILDKITLGEMNLMPIIGDSYVLEYAIRWIFTKIFEVAPNDLFFIVVNEPEELLTIETKEGYSDECHHREFCDTFVYKPWKLSREKETGKPYAVFGLKSCVFTAPKTVTPLTKGKKIKAIMNFLKYSELPEPFDRFSIYLKIKTEIVYHGCGKNIRANHKRRNEFKYSYDHPDDYDEETVGVRKIFYEINPKKHIWRETIDVISKVCQVNCIMIVPF